MDNSLDIVFINKPVITSVSPSSGFVGTEFIIQGDHLVDVTSVSFLDSFSREVPAVFFIKTEYGNSVITGYVPDIDDTYGNGAATTGQHLIIVRNDSGQDEYCCFTPWVTTQTNIPNISGDVTSQSDDRYAINAAISNAPTNTQGYEVLSLSYSPKMGNNKIMVQCEVSLQSNFWGAAVVALFKDSETTPRKVWNYPLMGLNMGQVAKLGYVMDAGGTAAQTWKVRVGRAENTYPIIYVNRNSETSVPYGGAASSWMSITEIQT